ncbi:MAG: hypothetical protein JRI23_00270 [Deltaproteobacteria bacterium]|nr:hypothetical protein [Deltaproteobacteria bacterium]MBW2529876.1 hypothetical protein [Deltaproteobacteria bacterium]
MSKSSRGRWWISPIVALGLGGVAWPASAQPGGNEAEARPSSEAASPAAEQPEPAAEPKQAAQDIYADLEPIADDDKREVPDYDGRGGDPVDAADVALWVPRIVFSPVYVVSEYVIRWPLGKLVTAAEKNDLPALMVDFFTFGPEKKAGIVPTALIDFGLRSSIGFYFFWDDYIADGQDFRLRAATGGSHWFLVNAAHRTWIDEPQDTSAEARFEYSRRPDWEYHGLGPTAPDEAESEYEAQRIEGGVRFRSRYWRTSSVETYLAVRDVRFWESGDLDDGDVHIGNRVAQGFYPYPPGWDDGYTIFLQRAEASLDTRELRDTHVGDGSDFVSPPGTGLRLALRGQLAEGLRATPRLTYNGPDRHYFVTYGGTLGGFLDLNQKQRVIGLSAIVDFADPLVDGSEIPFTELASLGGARPLRGFLERRLLGRSAVAWRFEYRWPVWVWLDGAAHYTVGNVFGKHLEGFEAGLLRQSFGLGIRSIAARDHAFEVLLAFGTKPFDEGGTVDNVRFVLGTTGGF